MPAHKGYLTIRQLSAYLNISYRAAGYLAKSDHLRSVKGAVLNLNTKGKKGKYEKLVVNPEAAVKVFEAHPLLWR